MKIVSIAKLVVELAILFVLIMILHKKPPVIFDFNRLSYPSTYESDEHQGGMSVDEVKKLFGE